MRRLWRFFRYEVDPTSCAVWTCIFAFVILEVVAIGALIFRTSR